MLTASHAANMVGKDAKQATRGAGEKVLLNRFCTHLTVWFCTVAHWGHWWDTSEDRGYSSFHLRQMDLFCSVGILISQSVYHGQESKNKMGRSRFCRKICFTVYNGCAKGFCWDLISALSSSFSSISLNWTLHDECLLMITTCLCQDPAGGSRLSIDRATAHIFHSRARPTAFADSKKKGEKWWVFPKPKSCIGPPGSRSMYSF